MTKHISNEKLSKRNKKALDNALRKQWYFSPITRKVESRKKYRRQKHFSFGE